MNIRDIIERKKVAQEPSRGRGKYDMKELLAADTRHSLAGDGWTGKR